MVLNEPRLSSGEALSWGATLQVPESTVSFDVFFRREVNGTVPVPLANNEVKQRLTVCVVVGLKSVQSFKFFVEQFEVVGKSAVRVAHVAPFVF